MFTLTVHTTCSHHDETHTLPIDGLSGDSLFVIDRLSRAHHQQGSCDCLAIVKPQAELDIPGSTPVTLISQEGYYRDGKHTP
jgi:hypothetical protein